MATKSHNGYGEKLKNLGQGEFLTLVGRLDRGGSLQARRLSTGAVQFYWRYSHEGQTSREPIGVYDPSAPPKKLEPTVKGYSVAAALERCSALARTHSDRLNTGGLKEAKEEERRLFSAKKAAEVEKAAKTLGKLLQAYVDHLKAQERRSFYDADRLFQLHVQARWPGLWETPAADVTPDQILDMLRKLIGEGKGRTANKLRSYLRAAYQCAIDVRASASIPVVFKDFSVVFNPAAQTKREARFDRADKHPLSAEELRTYWGRIADVPGLQGSALRLHLLTGGQRIEQFVRLKASDLREDSMTIHDAKGRPGHGPRPHTLPLTAEAQAAVASLERGGEFVLSTTKGKRPISATTMALWAKDAVGDSIAGFQLKRIRSGVETLLAANGVSREIRGHVQSHGLTGVQARHYDGHDYMPEKRQALEILAAQVCRPQERNVVSKRRNA